MTGGGVSLPSIPFRFAELHAGLLSMLPSGAKAKTKAKANTNTNTNANANALSLDSALKRLARDDRGWGHVYPAIRSASRNSMLGYYRCSLREQRQLKI